MLSRLTLLLLTCLTLGLFTGSAGAVYEKADGFPWNLTLFGDQDRPIVEALGGGFFMNVGPTGIRAQITHENPTAFTVKFVFESSPAAGKIKAGDIIIGANGRVMNVAHQFGRRNVTGWAGPMEEMAKLIEDAQGKDGKLELIVWPGGKKSEQKKVMLQIEPVGRFADTYPFNCPRSDKLMEQLCDFIANEYQRTGKFGRQHTGTAAVLALMASGDNKYSPIIKSVVGGYANNRYDSLNGNGYICWSLGLDGIVIGEYYNLTQDKSLVPAAQSLVTAVGESLNWENGAYSHRPNPFIIRRIAEGGPAGYGPMSGTSGLIMLAQTLFRASGLDYDEVAYERLHQGYLSSWTDSGYIDYGMKDWEHVVIEPTGDSVGKAVNQKGIGYLIPTGMKGIEHFKVTWPAPGDARAASTDWLKNQKELDRARVVMLDTNKLLVVRDMTAKEPAVPYKDNGKPISHIFRTGTAALSYSIGHDDDKVWKYMSSSYAKACANSPNAILDGHASTLMHTLWGSLGASRSDRKSFQNYMQGMKWWFIMAQTHDGSFVAMPGRDYASTDHVYATRVLPTATAALILSVKESKLLITGADSKGNSSTGGSAQQSSTTSEQPSAPKPGQGSKVALLGDAFTAVHCADAAEALNKGVPFAQVLRTLDQATTEGGDRGREAVQFGMALRDWITRENKRLTDEAAKRPARTLTAMRDHAQRLTGYELPDAVALRDLVTKLNDDRDTRTLARYYELLDHILEQEARRGSSASTERERKQIDAMAEKLLEKQGLSELLVNDARLLREALKKP